jgi:hypothetical protein
VGYASSPASAGVATQVERGVLQQIQKGECVMSNMAGTGLLLSQGREFSVSYDLAQPADQIAPTEGTVFGDTKKLQAAFDLGPCVLRLQSGEEAKVVLLDLLSDKAQGAADFRIIGATHLS